MGAFITPDGVRYSLPGIDDPAKAAEAMKSHPVLKGNIPEGSRFEASDEDSVTVAAPKKFGKLSYTETKIPVPFGEQMQRDFPVAIPAVQAGKAIASVPSDVYQTAKGLAWDLPKAVFGAVTHPIDTYEKVSGSVKAIPERISEAVKGFNPEAAPRDVMEAISSHPVQTALTASMLPGASIPGAAATVAKKRETADKLSKYMMVKALKPLPRIKADVVDAAATAALREGGDIAKLGKGTVEAVADLTKKMDRAVDAYATRMEALGETISLTPARENMMRYRAELAKSTTMPKEDLAAVDKVLAGLDTVIAETGGKVPPTRALAIRRELNDKLRPIFQREKTTGGFPGENITKEVLMSQRAGVQKALHELMPETKALGIKESQLIDFAGMAARRMGWAGSHDIFGLPEFIAAFGGGGIADATAIRLTRTPQFLSRVAYALAKQGTLAKAGPDTLELLGLTKESALRAQKVLKALPASPIKMGGKTPVDKSKVTSSTRLGEGEQLEFPPETADAFYDSVWEKLGTESAERAAAQRAAEIGRVRSDIGEEIPQVPTPTAAQQLANVPSSSFGDVIPGLPPGTAISSDEAWMRLGMRRPLNQGPFASQFGPAFEPPVMEPMTPGKLYPMRGYQNVNGMLIDGKTGKVIGPIIKAPPPKGVK